MELIELIVKKSEIPELRRHITYLPDFAVDVDVAETDEELVVSYVLYERGELYQPMGHC